MKKKKINYIESYIYIYKGIYRKENLRKNLKTLGPNAFALPFFVKTVT